MKTLKEDTQIRRVCVDDMDLGVHPLRQTPFNFSEGRCLPRLALPRYTSVIQADVTPPPPALFDCYGCLRKIRRRHYHINRATGTRRTGNLSSLSSLEARSNRTSDTFGVTSDGQRRIVRVGIFDGYDEWSIKTSRRGTAALCHTIKLTIETSMPTWIKSWKDPHQIEADQHCLQQWKLLTYIYNANAVGRKQCTCKHGCHINGLINSDIDQDDEHINVVADDTGIFVFFWLW